MVVLVSVVVVMVWRRLGWDGSGVSDGCDGKSWVR